MLLVEGDAEESNSYKSLTKLLPRRLARGFPIDQYGKSHLHETTALFSVFYNSSYERCCY